MKKQTILAAAATVALTLAPIGAMAELKLPGAGRSAETDRIEAQVMADVIRACVEHASGGGDFRKLDLSAWPGLKPMSSPANEEDAYIDLRSDGVYVTLALAADECRVSTRSSLQARILKDTAETLEPLGDVRGPNKDITGFHVFRVKNDAGDRYKATVFAASASLDGSTPEAGAWVALTRE